MTKTWELRKAGERVAGPVYAGSRGAALSLLRDELGCKRLPNGTELVDAGSGKRSRYTPPFSISRSVVYHHTADSLECLRAQDMEGAKENALEDVTYLLVDKKGRIVAGHRTMKAAKNNLKCMTEAA